MNNRTNNELVLYYGITGGPCDGFGGGDAPFHPVVKHSQHTRPEHNRGDRRIALMGVEIASNK